MRFLAKKHYHLEENENEGSWAVSYGDMITLLLSFFVIYFTTDAQKEKLQKLNNVISFSMDGLKAVPNEIRKQAERSSMNFDMSELNGLDVKVLQKDDRVFISFGKFSFFKSGHTDMRPEGEIILRKFVEKYIPFSGRYKLSIKGFTDKVKVAGYTNRRFRDNLELSALRSISAMRIMQSAGVPLNRMEIAGAGELRALSEVIPDFKMTSENERNDYSRTVMLVISPDKESLL